MDFGANPWLKIATTIAPSTTGIVSGMFGSSNSSRDGRLVHLVEHAVCLCALAKGWENLREVRVYSLTLSWYALQKSLVQEQERLSADMNFGRVVTGFRALYL